MALVLTPEAPLAEWLSGLDAEIERAGTLFVERPVVLDLGLLDEHADTLHELPEAMARRQVRVIATENPPSDLGAFPPPLAGGRGTGEIELPVPEAAAPAPVRSLLIDASIRSGQQIVHPDGDVTIMGSVASGAEVMAGGSIHVYGALRGRAIAGFGGNPAARILCRKLQAELLAIDGFYMTADDMDEGLVGGPAMARLAGQELTITGLE